MRDKYCTDCGDGLTENHADDEKKKDSFEILIRGTEIFRINSQTKEIVEVFQCINRCLRGNQIEESYMVNFVLMEHQFSITAKVNAENQYIINVFGDTMFVISTENIVEGIMENETISAEYEECLNEYAAFFIVKREDMEIRVWITIN